jgi:hypothetical protein
MLYSGGFDHALDHLDELDRVWQWASSSGAGPGHWHEDAEALHYCFFTLANPAASAQQPAAVEDVEVPAALEMMDDAPPAIAVARRASS